MMENNHQQQSMSLWVAPRLRKPSSHRRTQQLLYANRTSNDQNNLPLGTQIIRDEHDIPIEYSCSTSSTTNRMELAFDYDITTSSSSIDALRLLEWSVLHYVVELIGLDRCRRLEQPLTIVGVSSRQLDVVDTSSYVGGTACIKEGCIPIKGWMQVIYTGSTPTQVDVEHIVLAHVKEAMQSPTILVGDVTNVTYIGIRQVLQERTTVSSSRQGDSTKEFQLSSVGMGIIIVSACFVIVYLIGLLVKRASKNKQDEFVEQPIFDLEADLEGLDNPRAEMVQPRDLSSDAPAPPAYMRQDLSIDVVNEVVNSPKWSPLAKAPDDDDDDSFRLEDPPASRLVANRAASPKTIGRKSPIKKRGRTHVLCPIHEDIIIQGDFREEISPPISPSVSTASI